MKTNYRTEEGREGESSNDFRKKKLTPFPLNDVRAYVTESCQNVNYLVSWHCYSLNEWLVNVQNKRSESYSGVSVRTKTSKTKYLIRS